jgi:hypothetical protein
MFNSESFCDVFEASSSGFNDLRGFSPGIAVPKARVRSLTGMTPAALAELLMVVLPELVRRRQHAQQAGPIANGLREAARSEPWPQSKSS